MTKRSKQAKSTDTIMPNKANLGLAGVGGVSSTASTGDAGGGPNGLAGSGVADQSGADGFTRCGIGGGLATVGTALIDNTNITGNIATKDCVGRTFSESPRRQGRALASWQPWWQLSLRCSGDLTSEPPRR